MKTPYVRRAIASIGVCIFFGAIAIAVLLFRRPVSPLSERPVSTPDNAPRDSFLRLNTPSAIRITEAREKQALADEGRTRFDPVRAMDLSDKEYRIQFERHRSIKTWKGAPCAKYHEFDGVLVKLLENGYGITEWPESIRAITSWSEYEHHNTNQLRLLGVAEEDIPREVERFRNENLGEMNRCRAMLKASTGIDSDDLLDDLMNTPLHWPFYNDPLNTANVVNHRGEGLLEDSDWMEAHHLDALANHTGEPVKQLTATEIATKYGDEPMFVNEYEAILDRKDIHPALVPYRDDAYYENKRRLSELGEQKLKHVQQGPP